MDHYSEDFFRLLQEGSRRSAETIVPIVMYLGGRFRSVVDIGCGLGTWLRVFQQHGVDDVLGIDGDYVDRAALEIPSERFLPHNLEKPINLRRQFDLVIALEVAEHLPRACAG